MNSLMVFNLVQFYLNVFVFVQVRNSLLHNQNHKILKTFIKIIKFQNCYNLDMPF